MADSLTSPLAGICKMRHWLSGLGDAYHVGMSSKLGLVSWGRRGASRRLLETTSALLHAEGIEHCVSTISADPGIEKIQGWAKCTVAVDLPRYRPALFVSYRLAARAARETVRRFREEGVSRILVLMPHPWDMYLKRALQGSKIELYMILHDAQPHPGDLWPRRHDLVRRARQIDCAIFLSQAVATGLGGQTKRYRVAEHPVLVTKRAPLPGHGLGKRVVFAGRILPYKGIDLLLEAWSSRDFGGARLVIAGEGRMPAFSEVPDLNVVNRWLSDLELEELIAGAAVVALPYREASQSGIIPLARALGVPVVATPVGGLPEQFLNGVEGLLAEDVSARSIADAIVAALSRSWVISPGNSPNESYLRSILA